MGEKLVGIFRAQVPPVRPLPSFFFRQGFSALPHVLFPPATILPDETRFPKGIRSPQPGDTLPFPLLLLFLLLPYRPRFPLLLRLFLFMWFGFLRTDFTFRDHFFVFLNPRSLSFFRPFSLFLIGRMVLPYSRYFYIVFPSPRLSFYSTFGGRNSISPFSDCSFFLFFSFPPPQDTVVLPQIAMAAVLLVRWLFFFLLPSSNSFSNF